MTSRIEYKSKGLVSFFHEQSGWNLASVKFFVLLIWALCKVKTDRFEKLALVIVAFTWAYVVGDYINHYVKPIKIKKHGKRARSIFKYGLNHISSVLLNAHYLHVINAYKFLSCT